MPDSDARWLALVLTLPTRNATARMRVWRGLKASGCGALRDGVYLLPDVPGAAQTLHEQAELVERAGGTAHLVRIAADDKRQRSAFAALFDRTAAYASLLGELREIAARRKATNVPELTRQLARLRRQFDIIAAQDFFPGVARAQVAAVLGEAEQKLARALSPDEPQAILGDIKRSQKSDFSGRIWATRKRPWIDRLASAWLIRRFIDTGARILWLERPRDCPRDAVGFDFDGATFTHVGARVTFEVLLASFGFDADAALARIGAAVHYLDAGGIPVAEAEGLKMVLRGAQRAATSDDVLLAQAQQVFDLIYSAYSEEKPA